MANKIWHNALLGVPDIMLRKKTDPVDSYTLPLGSFGDTAAVVWPLDHVVKHNLSLWSPSKKVSKTNDLSWVALLDLDEWQGRAFTWRAPVYQMVKYKTFLTEAALEPDTDGAEDLDKAVARKAFGALPQPVVKQFGLEKGCDAAEMTSLFQTLFVVVKFILKCTDAEVLDIIRVRCAEPTDLSTEAFMSLDAGLDIIKKTDEKEIKEEQAKMGNKKSEARAFKKEYKEKRASLREPEPKTKAKIQKLAKERRGLGCPRAPGDKLPESLFLPHAEAKKFCPPTVSIWRMRVVGGWACHIRPYPRASFTFKRWTERGALIKCYQFMWELFLADQGLEITACPFPQIFDKALFEDEEE